VGFLGGFMDEIDMNDMDPRLAKAMIVFGLKFAEYTKEMDIDLWNRAIDYAKTFTKVDGVEINFNKESNES
jgi:hypothetical protein